MTQNDHVDRYEARVFDGETGVRLRQPALSTGRLRPRKLYPLVVYLHGGGGIASRDGLERESDMSEPLPSPFCHIVIPAPDLRKAEAFYRRAFGWKVQTNVPGPRYWFFESGNVSGAFNKNAKPASGSVVLVLSVADMSAAIALIRENGGTITQEPSEIGDADPGRDAYFLDPNGNEMGIYAKG